MKQRPPTSTLFPYTTLFRSQIDHSPLEPNPALGAAIEKLSGRKLILTNGTRRHADAVLARSEEHTSELQSQSNLVCRLLPAKRRQEALVPQLYPLKRLPPSA